MQENKYQIKMGLPEDQLVPYVEKYVREDAPIAVTVDSLMENYKVGGILKTTTFVVSEKERPEVKTETTQQVLIGAIGFLYNPTQPDSIMIGFLYVDGKLYGDFKMLYQAIISEVKKGGWTYLGWGADKRTSKFIMNNAKNRPIIYQHYANIDDYQIKEAVKNESNKVSMEQTVEQEKPQPREKVVSEHVTESVEMKPLPETTKVDVAKTGSYPAHLEVKH